LEVQYGLEAAIGGHLDGGVAWPRIGLEGDFRLERRFGRLELEATHPQWMLFPGAEVQDVLAPPQDPWRDLQGQRLPAWLQLPALEIPAVHG
jgi:hypothetical protein